MKRLPTPFLLPHPKRYADLNPTWAMSRCIYCSSGGPFSEEHPLPACLGEFAGASLLLDRVCKSCNTEIGRAEEQFCRASPEAFFRAYYGISGRDFHEKVNPFERGSAGAPAIDFLAVHPRTDAETLWEFNFGEKTVREVRQVVVVDSDGAAHPVRVPQWMREVTELQQRIDALGVRAKEIHIFAAEGETEWLERLTSNLSAEVSWRSSQQPLSIQQAVARFQVTDKYVRTLAKIGFHYLLAVNPAVSGAEQGFAPVRQFIRYGGDMSAFFREESGSIIERPTAAHRPERPIHIVLVEWCEGYVQAKLQFFLGPDYDPKIYRLGLGRGVAALNGTGSMGHAYGYFEGGCQGKYSGRRVRDIGSTEVVRGGNITSR